MNKQEKWSSLQIMRWVRYTLLNIGIYEDEVPDTWKLIDNHMENILTDDSPIKCIHAERQALNPLTMVVDAWCALHHKQRDVLVIAQSRDVLLPVIDHVLRIASYMCPVDPFTKRSEGNVLIAERRVPTGKGVRLVGMVMGGHIRGVTAMQVYVKDAHLLKKEAWDTILEVVASSPGCKLWVETSRPPSELAWILDYDKVREFYVPQLKVSTIGEPSE
jgi:hypothetical protein